VESSQHFIVLAFSSMINIF